jgi:hypothetical protein
MKPGMLHVVCAVANPSRWDSRISLYKDFEQHMLDSGVKLTTVECEYGERNFQLHNPHVNMVHVRASGSNLAWNKESLLNIGISRTPEAQYIMTSDADIEFRHKHWAEETLHSLQHHHVVQPWSDCYDLGPNGEHLELHRSFCRLVFDKEKIVQGPNAKNGPYRFGHPGYAWAWTRQALDWLGGLIEVAALGAADHHMALALLGRVNDSIPGNMHPNYKTAMQVWQDRANNHISGNIGFTHGTIEHKFHGAKKKRAYVERWDILARHNFDPVKDLKKNTHGVVELSGNKHGLRHDIHRYFTSRDEDANSIG